MNRHLIQEHVASWTDGIIVEIGGGYGEGARRLRAGSDGPIYVIDPYLPCVDLCGGSYGPDTYKDFLAATKGLNITHIPKTAQEAVLDWTLPIDLLWIDIAADFSTLWGIIQSWAPFVTKYIAIGSIFYAQTGAREAATATVQLGFTRIEGREYDQVAVLKRTRRPK